MRENSYGVKLNKNLISKIVNEILFNQESYDEKQLMWIVGTSIGFGKFKSVEDIRKKRDKFERLLKNESAFDGGLGLSLMQFFSIEPKRTIIYEDFDGTGRTVKERIGSVGTTSSFCERILSFIPIFDKNSDHFAVDDQLKELNALADNYDVIEGRYYAF